MSQDSKNLIFIVDDDPDDRQIILDAFLENNNQVDYVFIEDGEELMQNLNSAESVYPSLILLDLNLPGIMGLQILKDIKGNKNISHIPVIILTTSTLTLDKKSSYDLGANCFLRKPDNFQTMVDFANAIVKLWLMEIPKREIAEDLNTI